MMEMQLPLKASYALNFIEHLQPKIYQHSRKWFIIWTPEQVAEAVIQERMVQYNFLMKIMIGALSERNETET